MADLNLTPEQKQERALAIKERKDKVGNLLESYRDEMMRALPKVITPEKMIRVSLTALNKNPKLLECTSTSLIGSILTSAQLGLLPDEVLGEAYLIPYNNNRAQRVECQFIIGYKGLCKLAYNSGVVKSIQAKAVFTGDVFEYELGLNEKLRHVPSGNKNPADITHFYAVVKMTTGPEAYVMNVMTRQEVEKIRDDSPNYKYAKFKETTVWGKYFEEMGQKTVLRKLMKFVPLSSDAQRALNQDELGDIGKQNFSDDILNMKATTDEALINEAMEESAENDLIQEAEVIDSKIGAGLDNSKCAEADLLNKIKDKKKQ